ncbi:MAG: CyaY protein [Rickettsiales bacterium]|jgi:CyaY protein
MTENDFLKLSEAELIRLADFIENNDDNSLFDVEYSDGILNIEIFSNQKIYVINKHSASQKIWFSSPVSGADYFAFDDISKKWLNDKKNELEQIIINELKTNFKFKS